MSSGDFPVDTSIREVEIKRAVIDPGSMLNFTSLSILEAADVPQDRIIRQPIEVSGFEGNCTYWLCKPCPNSRANKRSIWFPCCWLSNRVPPIVGKALHPPSQGPSFYVSPISEGYFQRKEDANNATYFDEAISRRWGPLLSRRWGPLLSSSLFWRAHRIRRFTSY